VFRSRHRGLSEILTSLANWGDLGALLRTVSEDVKPFVEVMLSKRIAYREGGAHPLLGSHKARDASTASP